MSLAPRHDPARAILWMMAATFASACGNAQARYLGESFAPFQIVFFSTFGAALWMMPWVMKRGLSRLKTKCGKRYGLRAVLELCGWAAAYHALTLLPLPAFTALGFLQPLLMSTAAVLLFGEQSTRHTWIAMATGFAGVFIILRPDFSGYLAGSLFVLFSVFCFTSCGLIIKTLVRTESPPVITFYMLSLTGILALPFALPVWKMPALTELPWVVLIGLTMIGTQYCVSNAIARAPLTTILPFSFCALIFSSALAYLFFDEVVKLWTILGGLVILGSAFYALYFTRRASRREAAAMAQHMIDP